MFIGEHQHTIDEKGRLALPARFRPQFAEGAVVTRGLDGCLFIYTPDEWQKLAEKLTDLPMSQSDGRRFSRLMLGGAFDVELDKQGRIILPAPLRQYAHLQNQVVVAGLYNHLEVWDATAWRKEQAEAEEKSDEIVRSLVDFGV